MFPMGEDLASLTLSGVRVRGATSRVGCATPRVMEFDRVPQGLELEGTLDDLKLVYRVLHAHLSEHEELLDSPLFMSLQDTLQHAAAAEGIDVTDHTQWQAWLGGKAPHWPRASQNMLN